MLQAVGSRPNAGEWPRVCAGAGAMRGAASPGAGPLSPGIVMPGERTVCRAGQPLRAQQRYPSWLLASNVGSALNYRAVRRCGRGLAATGEKP